MDAGSILLLASGVAGNAFIGTQVAGHTSTEECLAPFRHICSLA